ncbi:sensor histidine kinase [Paraclostridium sordellii]|uniref:sensor histidine kinase n=1 Tax=Paraclostridium sordellii TaxID=1505 RepID=UPI0005DF3889|nr:GHKL domain-containing protein [Paeniclostridium sordellii]CEO05773.1 two-component sensor histidine kinase [[Clostridium] sordellii] [Paeniclostridium sordellii]CEP86211.1 two-component sensor histidine kinase [[Clostridium] sordellii] [Paeniclostridium sordellii]CEP96463.1 two-component sensor histidine kinase [[Clostridium] sordellii] [Paeniclostridium sordellii]CEQ00071.1 two-component sensor histidine kinase [[Clostridium] sordellii] [Paeniclostridium sordellii]
MNITFMIPICILTLFIGSNIYLSKYEFYKTTSPLKISLITLFIAIILLFFIKLSLDFLSINFASTLLLKSLSETILILILIGFCFYIGIHFMKLIDSNNTKERELQNQNSKIEHKDNIIGKLRSQKHDYLKHLQVVYSLLNTGLNQDAKEHITNISNSFRSKTSRYGKVSYLDAIASLKYEECLMKNITFDVYIQDFIDNLIIEPSEMSSVLLNIIDNAIESLISIDKDNKYIKVFIYEDEFQYVISIKNNGPKIYNTDIIFTEGFSTKNGNNRGYGLYLTKQILDKYGYHIFATSDNFITEFTILIPKYF